MKKLFLTITLAFLFSIPAFGASGVYDGFYHDLFAKAVDMDSDTIKIGLLDDSHTFTAANDTWADVSANEVSATGYTAGGGTLDSPSITEGATFKWDADDETWTITGSMTAYHAVVYDTTNADSLICSFDFGGAKTATNGNFTVSFSASGIITMTD